jgi:hypothetical protein
MIDPEIKSKLTALDRSLPERQILMYRLALCEYIWLCLFPPNQRHLAKDAWVNLTTHCEEQKIPFTFALVDILEFKNPDGFWFFWSEMEKLERIINFIIQGNPQIEDKIPEQYKILAQERSLKIISNHIINKLN